MPHLPTSLLFEFETSPSTIAALNSGNDDLALFDGGVKTDRLAASKRKVDKSLQLQLERGEAVAKAGIESAVGAIDSYMAESAKHVVVDNDYDIGR